MYIGVGGKARLCYSAELEKVGMAENLSDERCTVAASVGNYALFAGDMDTGDIAQSFMTPWMLIARRSQSRCLLR